MVKKINEELASDTNSSKPIDLIITRYLEYVKNKARYSDAKSEYFKSLYDQFRVKYITHWNNKFSMEDVSNFLSEELIIKYSETFVNGDLIVTLYYIDPVTGILKELKVDTLLPYVNCALKSVKSNLDLMRTTANIHLKLMADKDLNNYPKIKPLPTHYSVFTNAIVNLKSKEVIDYEKDTDKFKELLEKYDITREPVYHYYSSVDTNSSKYQLWNKFINDLANNDEDQKLLFKQLVFAANEGFGRQRYIMMSGTPGSGKSTFGKILELVAGQQHVVYLTMDKFDDDNALNKINQSTKLILGDDLQKAAKLVGRSLRHYKSLINGSPIEVSVKYEPNRIVQTKGCFVQMMNDKPNIHEANDAMRDRSVLVHITGKNHRGTKNVEERSVGRMLDDYTGKFTDKADEEFISIIISDCINTLEYFEEFSISDKMREDTASMIDDANWPKQFVDWLESLGALRLNYLPSADLYKLFDYWMRENNPGLGKPSSRKFNQEINQYMGRFGFELDGRTQYISKNKLKYSRSLFTIKLGVYSDYLSAKSSTVWKTSNKFKFDDTKAELLKELDKPLTDRTPYEDLPIDQLMVAEYLIEKEYNADIIAWKSEVEL